jgi:hypothetical protein
MSPKPSISATPLSGILLMGTVHCSLTSRLLFAPWRPERRTEPGARRRLDGGQGACTPTQLLREYKLLASVPSVRPWVLLRLEPRSTLCITKSGEDFEMNDQAYGPFCTQTAAIRAAQAWQPHGADTVWHRLQLAVLHQYALTDHPARVIRL